MNLKSGLGWGCEETMSDTVQQYGFCRGNRSPLDFVCVDFDESSTPFKRIL